MSENATRVLLVEENNDVATSLQSIFVRDEGSWEISIATSLDQARRCLDVPSLDLMIVDSRMTDASEARLLCRVSQSNSVPFVLLMGQSGETEAAVVIAGVGMHYEVSTEFVLAHMPGIAKRALRNWQLEIARQLAEHQQSDRFAISSHDNHDFELGEFLTELVHEVSQPLAAIVNYAGICVELVADKRVHNDDLRDPLIQIHQQAQRAGGIIRRLQCYISSDAPQRSNIDLNQLVREVASIMRLSLQSHHALIRFQIDRRLPRVWADAVQIQQVLVNLIQNALEAMHDVEPDLRHVSVTAAKDSENVRVAVSDRGQGVSRDVLEKIFDARFSTKANSLGVGLSISRRIIEQHGGRLWATSNQGRGATFAFTLPIANLTTVSGVPEWHMIQHATLDMKAEHHRAN